MYTSSALALIAQKMHSIIWALLQKYDATVKGIILYQKHQMAKALKSEKLSSKQIIILYDITVSKVDA